MRAALVIGYGSIGTRHARILAEMGLRTGVVSRRGGSTGEAFTTLKSGLETLQPDYVVVANETVQHIATLDELDQLGYRGVVLVEKPLAVHALEPRNWAFAQIKLAYNLRFHPVLQALAKLLTVDRPLLVQAYVGQYLPDWRPDSDYRHSYSAQRALGGGVLRDLSHELDFLAWLFGDWRRLSALGGRRGSLDIDSDDCWAVLFEGTGGLPITLHLNYLDRVARRELVVVSDRHSYRADLVTGILEVDGEAQTFSIERDTTYREQHRAALEGRWSALCSLEEGITVMSTIASVEQAAATGQWVMP
jgi:predicted dehydrogenase